MSKTHWFTKFNLSIFMIGVFVLIFTGCQSEDTSASDEGDDQEVNYSEEVDHTIIGIEPGAGITVTTEEAIEEYDSLEGWTLEQSSTTAKIGRASCREREDVTVGA